MMSPSLFRDDRDPSIVVHGDGAFHLIRYLAIDEQRALMERCDAIVRESPGAYRPRVRGGGTMHLEMLCLGRHWNALTYKYEATRGDRDGQAVQPLPADLAALAERVAGAVGYQFVPDICLMNRYQEDGRLGLHQDRDESAGSIAAGIPIVSISIGDTARFLLGGVRRKDEVRPILLGSGDAFVLSGPSRLRHHGVSRILPGTAPPELKMTGRLNLTFRRY
jgi:alkylated DNA repair protein (DNA oxidative demethylase)